MRSRVRNLIDQLHTEVMMDLNQIFRPRWLPPESIRNFSLFFIAGLEKPPSSESHYLGLEELYCGIYRPRWEEVVKMHYDKYMKGPFSGQIGEIQEQFMRGVDFLYEISKKDVRIKDDDLDILHKAYDTVSNQSTKVDDYCSAVEGVFKILSKCKFTENLLSIFLRSRNQFSVFPMGWWENLMKEARKNVQNNPIQLLGLLCESVIVPNSALICMAFDSWSRNRMAILMYTWGSDKQVEKYFKYLNNHPTLQTVLHLIVCKLSIGEMLKFANQVDEILSTGDEIEDVLKSIRCTSAENYGIDVLRRKKTISIKSGRKGEKYIANKILDKIAMHYIKSSIRSLLNLKKN